MTPTLIRTYEAAEATLLEEIEACGASDVIVLHLFILEPGPSSESVLKALCAATERGASVQVSIDATPASALGRLVERTDTLLPKALALGAAVDGLEVVARKTPDHAKYALFVREAAPPTVLWGGINLGDRFRPWRDFMVRLAGEAGVRAVQQTLAGEGQPSYPPAAAVSFVANVPDRGVFEIREVFEALATDASLTRLRLAMAYVDSAGAEILRTALERGAAVDLLLAQEANVYHHANMRALCSLLDADGFRAYLHPDMVHAKVLLAHDVDGPRRAFLGSANLKQNSLCKFKELNALVDAPAFVADLDDALDALFAEADPVTEPPPYNPARALIEQSLG